MMKNKLLILLIISPFCVLAQDSTRVLPEISIHAFRYNKPLAEVPAAVSVIGQEELRRFSNTSILPALNTAPGVKMEERSPGSFRLSIRGSSMRSPFGVRNVKVYWNEIPFTDPGGNTYLNSLDFSSVQAAEVVKGPSSSLYGAGTGGVLLLKSQSQEQSHVAASTTLGSFGLRRYALSGAIKTANSQWHMLYANQRATGYRQHTAMKREVFQASTTTNFAKGSVSAMMLYSDLFYQTPGALTKVQYDDDPTQARPAAGASRGAQEQHAAVFNKTLFTGFAYDYDWTENWSTRAAVYGSYSLFHNPTIRNQERRVDTHSGARITTMHRYSKGQLTFGGEIQAGFSPVKVYENDYGQQGALQQDDELGITTRFAFAQHEIYLPRQFSLTYGLSVNTQSIRYRNGMVSPLLNVRRELKPIVSPRVALHKKFSDQFSVYTSYNHGYSPPTLQELYPSTGRFDYTLAPEQGDNIELGVRMALKTISINVTGYNFRLRETIVNRRDASLPGEPEYFVNAGKTRQHGIEAEVRYRPVFENADHKISLWLSYTWNDYRFADYRRGDVNYAKNRLTGVAPNVIVAGADAEVKHFYLNLTATYNDHIPLNDGNTAFAKEYLILATRVGWRTQMKMNIPMDVFVGSDNVLNKKYSLGNDLNAIGGRYYNAAPTRNFYAGLAIKNLFNAR